jgi:hypothetical protein
MAKQLAKPAISVLRRFIVSIPVIIGISSAAPAPFRRCPARSAPLYCMHHKERPHMLEELNQPIAELKANVEETWRHL